MASFKIFCKPVVEFNPYIHTDIKGFDAAQTLYNRGKKSDITIYTGIYENGNHQFIWTGVLWNFTKEDNQKVVKTLELMYGRNENTQVFMCYPSCEEAISKEIPESNLVFSLGMVIIALISLKRYRNT